MKKILLVALAAAGAALRQEEDRRGPARAGPVGRGDRHASTAA